MGFGCVPGTDVLDAVKRPTTASSAARSPADATERMKMVAGSDGSDSTPAKGRTPKVLL